MSSKFDLLKIRLQSLLHNFPLLLDMVEEKVRSRCITISTIFFIYIVLIFTLISFTEYLPVQLESVKSEISLKNSYYLSQNISAKSPTPRIKLEASDPSTYLSDWAVRILPTVLVADQLYESSVSCSSQQRASLFGTLEYFRLSEQCRVVLDGALCTTNSIGRCSFPALRVQRGPQGEYTFVYLASPSVEALRLGLGLGADQAANPNPSLNNPNPNPNNPNPNNPNPSLNNPNPNPSSTKAVRSSPFQAYFTSRVERMNLAAGRTPPQVVPEMGKAFAVQPRVRLLDSMGRPIVGKRAVAFSWPEQTLGFSQSEYYIDANKFALLGNAVSKPSDEDGFAEWEGLSILGMSGQAVYIFLSVDNTKTMMWERPRSSVFDAYQIPRIRFPILAKQGSDPKFQLKILNNDSYSRSVLEGQVFANPIQIQMFQSQNNAPAQNQLVFALLYGENGKDYPFGYRLITFGVRSKQLLRPIPGVYNDFVSETESAEINVADNDNGLFQPLYTDSSGIVTFNRLAFSTYGPSGKYKIRFSCQGDFVESEYITVQSTVQRVLILQQPPQIFNQEMQDVDTQFRVVVQAVDARGEGVEGKTPEIQILRYSKQSNNNDTDQVISSYILNFMLNLTVMEPTDKDGLVTLKFVYNFCVDEEISFRIAIFIDGRRVVTDPVHFIDKIKISEKCGGVIVTNSNISDYILQNHYYFMEFLVFGEDGMPLPNAIVAISNLNQADSITKMPKSIRPDCKMPTATRYDDEVLFMISDNQGKARFDGIYCDKGAQGYFRFAFLALSGYTDPSKTSNYQQQQRGNETTTQYQQQDQQNQQQQNGQQQDIQKNMAEVHNTRLLKAAKRELRRILNNNNFHTEQDEDNGASQNKAFWQQQLNKEDYSFIQHKVIEQQEDYINPQQQSTVNSATDWQKRWVYQDFQNQPQPQKILKQSVPEQQQQQKPSSNSYQTSHSSSTSSQLQDPSSADPSSMEDFLLSSAQDGESDIDYLLDDLQNNLPGEASAVLDAAQAASGDSNSMQSKSKTEVKLCVARLVEVRFVTKISYIDWVDIKPDTNASFHSKKANFSIRMSDFYRQPLRNYPVALSYIQSNVPGYDVPFYDPLKQAGFYQRYFTFQLFSPQTDNDGVVTVQAELKPYKIGFLAFSFMQEGIVTSPIVFASDFYAKSVEIIEQPPTNINSTTAIQTGMYLSPPIFVKVTDKDGNPVPNYPVVANIVKLDLKQGEYQFNYVISDHSSFNPEETLVVGAWLQNITNASGIAAFHKLTPLFTRKRQCVQFYFVTGDIGGEGQNITMIARSNKSNIFCYEEQLQVLIANKEAFSKQVSCFQPFKVPIVVRVLYKKVPQVGIEYILGIGGMLYQIDEGNQKLYNPVIQTDNMLGNWFCLFNLNISNQKQLKKTPQQLRQCSVEFIGSDSQYQAIIQLTFTQLSWKLSKGAKFRLSFSSITNYASPDDDVMHYEDLPLDQPELILEEAKQMEADFKDNQNFQSIKSNLEVAVDLKSKIANLKSTIQSASSSLPDPSNPPSSPAQAFQQISQTMKAYNQVIGSLSGQIQDFINARPESDQTPPIVAVNQPFTISVRRQPPQVFYVRDLVPLEVVCMDQIGNLMQSVTVTASIVPESTFLNQMSSSSELRELVQNMGKAQLSFQSLGDHLKKSHNIVLDPKRRSGVTSVLGFAQVNVKVLTAAAFGIFCIQFEAKGASSGKTTPFLLKNHITDVKVLNVQNLEQLQTSLSHQQEVEQNQGEVEEEQINVYTRFDLQDKDMMAQIPNKNFILKVNFDNKTADPNYEKDIKVYVYRYVDFQELQSQTKNQVNQSAQSAQKIYGSVQNMKEKDLSQEDVGFIIGQVKEKVVNAGSLGKQVSFSPEKYISTFDVNTLQVVSAKRNLVLASTTNDQTNTKQNSNNNNQNIITQYLQISNLKIQFLEPGEFQLVFSVDGVDSQIAPYKIVVSEDLNLLSPEDENANQNNNNKIDKKISQFLENIISFLLIPAIILVNISINHSQQRYKRNLLYQKVLLVSVTLTSLALMVILFNNDNLQDHAFIYSYRIVMVFFLIICYVDIGLQLFYNPKQSSNQDHLVLSYNNNSDRLFILKQTSQYQQQLDQTITDKNLNKVYNMEKQSNILAQKNTTEDLNAQNQTQNQLNQKQQQQQFQLNELPLSLPKGIPQYQNPQQQQMFLAMHHHYFSQQSYFQSFYEDRIIISVEYTFQLLFNRPSRFWFLRVQQKYPPSQITEQNYFSLYLKEKEKFSQMNMFMHIFYPYSMRKRCLSLHNSFFYPQRALTGITVSFFACLFITYLVFGQVEGIREDIEDLGRQIQDTFTLYISTATNYIMKAGGVFEITEEVYGNVFDIMNIIQKQIMDFSYAIYVALIIGQTFAIIIFILVTVGFLIDFRRRIFLMKRGQDIQADLQNAEKRILINIVDTYTSDYISTLTLGYIVVVLIITLIFLPLCMPIFWTILYDKLGVILSIIISSIISTIINKIEKKIVYDGDSIRVRHLHAILEIIQIYLNIIAGIFSAIVRFIKASVIGILLVIIPFYTVFCQWVINLMNLDKIYAKYLAMIQQNRMYNNPIVICFLEIIKNCKNNNNNNNQQNNVIKQSQVDASPNNSQKEKVVNYTLVLLRNKIYLIYFMYKHQKFNLIQFRKKYLSNYKLEKSKFIKDNSYCKQPYIPLMDPENQIIKNNYSEMVNTSSLKNNNYKLMQQQEAILI